jgi:hypothetical protein
MSDGKCHYPNCYRDSGDGDGVTCDHCSAFMCSNHKYTLAKHQGFDLCGECATEEGSKWFDVCEVAFCKRKALRREVDLEKYEAGDQAECPFYSDQSWKFVSCTKCNKKVCSGCLRENGRCFDCNVCLWHNKDDRDCSGGRVACVECDELVCTQHANVMVGKSCVLCVIKKGLKLAVVE